jgi:c-di-GMP-binding flagellar brake protein YcgR
MYFLYIFLIITPILALIALLMTEKGATVKEFMRFLVSGLDSGFTIGQISFLWKIGTLSELEDRTSLFWSLPALDRCTSEILRKAKQIGIENDEETQTLLSKLYSYRTKIGLEQAKKKHGLDSTREITEGQRVRILLRGVGVFSSKVVKNTSQSITLDYPVGGPGLSATSIDWMNKSLSVYFWRHDDAGYVFDTVVVSDPMASGRALINVSHSSALLRSQKRRSIRVKCSIYAQMYLVKQGDPLLGVLEPEPGMKCLLEDISEDGAMVIIGGKAAKGMRIKLQFTLNEVLIIMVGTVRAVEYNNDANQSRIHFESEELNPRMKNAILAFVYNVLPEEQKEELDAIRLTEEDGREDDGATGPVDLDDESVGKATEAPAETVDLP